MFDAPFIVQGPHSVNSIGRIEPSWVPPSRASGSVTARFTIVNGFYTKTVDVTYSIP